MKKSIMLLLALTALLSACVLPVRTTDVRGSGNVKTETRNVSGFNRVELSIPGKITIIQGEEEGLEISADDNILPKIETTRRGDTLQIKSEEGVNIHPSNDIVYTLKVKHLFGIYNSSLGEIIIDNLTTDKLEINISSNGNVTIQNLQVNNLVVQISSSGSLSLKGKADQQIVDISSSGNYLAGDLQSQIADIKISSSGDARLWVTQSLKVQISSSGNLEYYGNPQVSEKTSSSGKVISLGEHQ